jgi:hypothetical protein
MTDEIDVFAQLEKNANEILLRIAEVEAQIKNQQDTIAGYTKYMNSKDLKTEALGAVLLDDSIQATAVGFLTTSATNALEQAPEFNHPIFITDLFAACSHAESIKIFLLEGKIKVEIDLNKTAGNIAEYAAAVENARKQLDAEKATINKRGGKNKTPGRLATEMWFEKIYSVDRLGKGDVPRKVYNRHTREYEIINVVDKYKGKYFETMALRKSFYMTGHSAPWWYLLEYGNTKVVGFGDRGGYAKPSNPATHFVKNAKKEIENFLDGRIESEREKLKQGYAKAITASEQQIEFFQGEVEKLTWQLEDTSKFRVTEDELVRYLREIGNEQLIESKRFNAAVNDIIQFGSRMRNGFSFGSGERHRLVTVYRRMQAALAG